MSEPLKVGDREWRKIEGFDYSVSNDGEVRRDSTGLILKGGVNPGGYRTVSLIQWEAGKRIQVQGRHHQLVMRYFVGPRPHGMVINHKNGIKTDNRLINLEYCTPRDNREHAKAMQLYHMGSRCSWSKLSEDTVILMRKAHEIGMSTKQLARAFEVSKKAVQLALKGRNWKHV